MPPPLPKVVPWVNQEEWEQLYSWLYASDNPEDLYLRELGVKRAKAWASRGKIPHAVDATVSLLEVWLRDGCGGMYVPAISISEHETRLLYSMAFIRFVNGFIDQAQRGMYAASAASVAEQLGLPGWFVELRHAGTHDQLPSLLLLRSGCTQALGWLNENYWKVQKTYVADTGMEVRNLLLRYKERRKIAGKAKGTSKDDQEAEHLLSEVTTIITVDTYREILIPILASQGLLVPVAKKKRSNQQLELSPALVQLWTPALERLERTWPGFLNDTFVCLVETVDEQTSATSMVGDGGEFIVQSLSFTTTLAAWAGHICRTYSSKLNIKECVDVCLRRPNKYCLALLAELRKTDPALEDKLMPLLAFLSGRIETEKTQDPVFDIPDYIAKDDPETLELRARIHKIKGSVIAPLRVPNAPEPVRALAQTRSTWRKCDKEQWRAVPIGCLSGGVVPSLGLNLQLDGATYAASVGVLQHPVFQPVAEVESVEDEAEPLQDIATGNADIEMADVETDDSQYTQPAPPHIIARVSLL